MPSFQQNSIRTIDTHLYRKPNGVYHYRFNIKDNGTYRSVRLSMYSRCLYEAGALAGLVTYRTWKSKSWKAVYPTQKCASDSSLYSAKFLPSIKRG
jgi:hypothetical protein